jgi:AcrR family transcriptional regulator
MCRNDDRAALAELAEVGYGGFTIESVAARARVGKATIYRHWSGKLALIADAFETLNQQPRPAIACGSPRERVRQIVLHVAEAMGDSVFSACVPALVEAAERHPEVRAFLDGYNAQRRQTLIDVLAEGIAVGDFPVRPDPELTALALVGPISYHRLLTSERFDPTRVDDLIDTVLGTTFGPA